MSGAYEFFSKWTKLDELLAPYSDRSFERVFVRFGGTMMKISAVLSVVLIVVALFGFGRLAVEVAERSYLAHYGVAARGTIETVVPDKPDYRGRINWTTITYRFKAASGEQFTEQTRREFWSVKGIRRGQPIEVLYAADRPHLNLAKIDIGYVGYLQYMAVLCLAFITHLALYLRRYLGWRRRDFAFDAHRAPSIVLQAAR